MYKRNSKESEYLGLAVNVHLGSVSVRQHRAAVAGIEPDRDTATRLGIEGVQRFEAVFVKNVSDLQLVLVPTSEA